VIDASKAEGAIQTNLERSLHEKVTSVVCPSGQKVEPGNEFTCTIDFANGKHATVTLKIRNKEADTDEVGFKYTK
jgi:predicted ATP-binding protein involved in virulence